MLILTKYRKRTILGALIFTALVLFTMMSTSVPTGHVGIVRVCGSVQDGELPAGFHFPVHPLGVVVDVSTQIRNDTVSYDSEDPLAAVTVDSQSIGFQLDVGWSVVSSQAGLMVEKVGVDPEIWDEQVMLPCMFQATKVVLSSRPLTGDNSIIGDRRRVAQEIEDNLRQLVNERLNGQAPELEGSITILQVNLSNITYSDSYEQVILEKQEEQERILTANNTLERVRTEVRQQVARAEAERDSAVAIAQGEAMAAFTRSRGEALALLAMERARVESFLWMLQAGVNPVDYLYYQQWNGELPRVFTGGDAGLVLPVGQSLENITEEDIQLILEQMDESIAELTETFDDMVPPEYLQAQSEDEECPQTQPEEDE